LNEQDEEKRLRGFLEEAHRADRTPPFRRTWEGARQTEKYRRPLWPLVPAIAALALLILWNVRPNVSRGPAPQSMPGLEWNAPLDFLLQTPGSELLNTVPKFDADRSLP